MRDAANDLDAGVVKVQQPDCERRRDDRRNRPGLGRDIRHPRTHTNAAQCRLEPLAHPEQERGGADPDDECGQVELRQIQHKRPDQFQQIVPFCRNPEDVAQLACGDNQTRGGDEPRNHRMRQEVGQKAKSQEPQPQQHRPGQPRQ